MPVALELAYGPGVIDGRMRYVVSARILAGERVLSRTTTAYVVLIIGGSERVAVLLEPMAGSGTPAPDGGTAP